MADVADIRYIVRSTLVTKMRADTGLANVQVELGFPGDTLRRESIWLGASDGNNEVPSVKAGRKIVEDKFITPVEIYAGTGGQDLDAAEARVQALANIVENIVLNDATLGITPAQGLIGGTVLSAIRGPATRRTKDGAESYIRLELSSHARLS